MKYQPTRAEFERARGAKGAYVVVDVLGLRWELRPVARPPRTDREPPTVRRRSSLVVAERMIAEGARRG